MLYRMDKKLVFIQIIFLNAAEMKQREVQAGTAERNDQLRDGEGITEITVILFGQQTDNQYTKDKLDHFQEDRGEKNMQASTVAE